MTRKLVKELIDTKVMETIEYMIINGCTALELITQLCALTNEFGDSMFLCQYAGGYDQFELEGSYKRPETKEETDAREIREERYRQATIKRKKTILRKAEEKIVKLQKQVSTLSEKLGSST